MRGIFTASGRRTRLLLGAGAALAAIGFAAPPSIAATVAPSLMGESMGASSGFPTGGTVTVSATCNPSGTSTISFTAAGAAFGPYPGTYTASGSATIGPQTIPSPQPSQFFQTIGPVQSFSESFTIKSATGTVQGTKSLPPPGEAGALNGVCQTSPFNGPVWEIYGAFGYQATITLSDRSSFSDSGYGSVDVFNKQSPSPSPPGFVQGSAHSESFLFSNGVVALCDENVQNNQNQGQNNQGCANP